MINHKNPRPLKFSPPSAAFLLTFALVFLTLGTAVTQQALIASPKPTGEKAHQDYLWCNCTQVNGVTTEKKSQGFQRD